MRGAMAKERGKVTDRQGRWNEKICDRGEATGNDPCVRLSWTRSSILESPSWETQPVTSGDKNAEAWSQLFSLQAPVSPSAK